MQIAIFAHSRLNKWSRIYRTPIVAAAGELERPLRIKLWRIHLNTAVLGSPVLGFVWGGALATLAPRGGTSFAL